MRTIIIYTIVAFCVQSHAETNMKILMRNYWKPKPSTEPIRHRYMSVKSRTC